MKNFYLTIILSSLFIISCSNDEIVENAFRPETAKSETLTFIYKGVTYSSEYIIEDGVTIIKDEKVREVCENLQNLPDLCTFVKEDGNIEYFDSYEDIPENDYYTELRSTSDEAYVVGHTLKFYDKRKYAGNNYIDTYFNYSPPVPYHFFNAYFSSLFQNRNVYSIDLTLDKNPNAIQYTIWSRLTLFSGDMNGHSIVFEAKSETGNMKIPDISRYFISVMGYSHQEHEIRDNDNKIITVTPNQYSWCYHVGSYRLQVSKW